jgi:cell division protein FtsQ
MSPVAVSADRRFHRAHVKPARRRRVWRGVVFGVIKYAVLLAAVVYGASRAAQFASTSPLLHIDRIEPSGNQRLSSDEIRTILSGLRGENILFADLGEWRQKLLESPWVRDATFSRSLPSTIAVSVDERAPIAIGRMKNELYLFDERGVAIDAFGPQYAGLDLPIVDGFAAAGTDAEAARARGSLAARLIVDLRRKPDVARRLSQVDVTDAHNVTILLNDDPAELRVGENHFLERVESYLSLAGALRQRVPEIDYVDLRFDGRVYVRPLGRSRTGATAAERPAVSPVIDVDTDQH